MGHGIENRRDPLNLPPFRTVRVGDVEEPPQSENRWLAEELWTSKAVAVLGGPPKCAKTWLAVDIAVSVASGTPVLGRYNVPEPGPVLFFGAEDDRWRLKARFLGIASRRGLSLGALEARLLDVFELRLDQEQDQLRLICTIDRLRPKLLVLDPLVRLHRLQENSSMEISGLLGYLRMLQRAYAMAVLLVHHTRKMPGPANHPGQGLRGSSDIQAWADELFYLDRVPEGLRLLVEHRSAPPQEPVTLRLAQGPSPYLEIVEGQPCREPGEDSFADEVLWLLSAAPGPLRLEDLREKLGVRKQRIVDALRHLNLSGRVRLTTDGYVALP